MKKKHVKKLRELAAQLPGINIVRRTEKEQISGHELIASGVSKLSDGTIIEPKQFYTKTAPVQQPINHVRQMKKLMKQHGAKGVGMYVGAVQNYVQQRKTA